MVLQNGSVAKVKELIDVLNNGEGLTTSVDITDVVGMTQSVTCASFQFSVLCASSCEA